MYGAAADGRAVLRGDQRHADVHAAGARLPPHPAGPGQDGQRALRPGLRAQDGHAGRGRAALGERRADRRCRTRPSTRPPSSPPSPSRPTSPSSATARSSGASRTTARQEHSISFSGLQVQVVARGTPRRQGAPGRPQRARLEGHRAPRPARVVPAGAQAGRPRAAVHAARQRAPVRRDPPRRAPRAASPSSTRSRRRPAVVVNGTGDYSWEYAWSIHLPGGEESHMVASAGADRQPAGAGRPDGVARPAGGRDAALVPVHLPAHGHRFRGAARGRRGLHGRRRLVHPVTLSHRARATAGTVRSRTTPRRAAARATTGCAPQTPAGSSPWSAPADVDVP